MPFCYELRTDICGVPIQNVVNAAFFHLTIHGIFVCSFVFSNTSYPPYYYVDYMYGIAGGALIAVSIIGGVFACMRQCQPLRSLVALIVVLNVLTVIVTSFWYAVARWNDVITTALTRAIRRPEDRDYPDYFWYTLTVTACCMFLPFLIYLIYIMSFMCNRWRSNLFTYDYEQTFGPYYVPYTPQITVPQVPASNAYPTQKTH